MTHDQHDEDMARHQLQAKRIVKCIGRSHGGGAGGRGGDSSKSSPVSGQLLVYHRLGRQAQHALREVGRAPAQHTPQEAGRAPALHYLGRGKCPPREVSKLILLLPY